MKTPPSRFMSLFPSSSLHFYRPWCFQTSRELDGLLAKMWIFWMKIGREIIFQSWLLQNASFHYFSVVHCWSRRKYMKRKANIIKWLYLFLFCPLDPSLGCTKSCSQLMSKKVKCENAHVWWYRNWEHTPESTCCECSFRMCSSAFLSSCIFPSRPQIRIIFFLKTIIFIFPSWPQTEMQKA